MAIEPRVPQNVTNIGDPPRSDCTGHQNPLGAQRPQLPAPRTVADHVVRLRSAFEYANGSVGMAAVGTPLDGLGRREVARVGDHRETAPLPVGGALLEEEQQRLDRALVHLEETVGGEPIVVREHGTAIHSPFGPHEL